MISNTNSKQYGYNIAIKCNKHHKNSQTKDAAEHGKVRIKEMNFQMNLMNTLTCTGMIYQTGVQQSYNIYKSLCLIL